MKYLLQLFIFLLPFHAIFVTYMKCKAWIDTDILRFWKEFVIIFLLFVVAAKVLWNNHFKLEKIYKNNYLLGLTTAFTLTSLVYIYFPYFQPKLSSYLGFKYDVFFLFALIIWVYLATLKNHFESMLKSVFASIWIMLVIFLPWYLIGDISTTTNIIGFSDKPSTYEANSCISFSQNVTGGHNRFQWSFGDPIRFSVFLVVFYFIYLGFVLHTTVQNKVARNFWIWVPTLLILTAIFFAYTKTSMLGFLFGSLAFIYFVRKIKFWKTISKKFIAISGGTIWVLLFIILYVKRHLFLHPEAILGRVENLIMSIDMFFYNPFGYGLWIAWPASQLATSSDQALSAGVNKFLPENWYVQILLEQSLLGLGIFIWLLSVIWVYLYRIMKLKKDYLSIWIFVSYITILFMANFTHIFEETATSFILFMLIGGYIAKESRDFRKER